MNQCLSVRGKRPLVDAFCLEDKLGNGEESSDGGARIA